MVLRSTLIMVPYPHHYTMKYFYSCGLKQFKWRIKIKERKKKKKNGNFTKLYVTQSVTNHKKYLKSSIYVKHVMLQNVILVEFIFSTPFGWPNRQVNLSLFCHLVTSLWFFLLFSVPASPLTWNWLQLPFLSSHQLLSWLNHMVKNHLH